MKKTTNLLRALILAVALIVCMCVLFVSCGEEENPTPTSSSVPSSTTGSTDGGTTQSSGTGDQPCEHKGGVATCQAKAVCTECGEEYGELADHSYADATCVAPKTCSVCEATEGEALGHAWAEATCAAPKTCSVCEATEGEALGHTWVDATCAAPKTCSVCAATEGEALAHVGGTATCTELAICDTCGEAYGDLAEHTWVDATCLFPKMCDYCALTEGDPLGHALVDNVVAATCTIDGITYVTCENCDYSDTKDPVAATGHNVLEGVCQICQETPKVVGIYDIESIVASHEGGGAPYLDKLFDGNIKTSGIYGAVGNEYFPEAVDDNFVITLNNEILLNEFVFYGGGNWTQLSVTLFDAEGNEVAATTLTYDGGHGEGDAVAIRTTLESAVSVKSLKVQCLSLKWGTGGTQKTTEIVLFVDKCAGEHEWLFTGYDEYNAPTCDIEGIANYECIACGAQKQETALHRMTYGVGFVEGQEPTCTTYGYAMFECMWCSESETRLVAPQHDYQIESDTYVAPTCTENGSQTITCTMCGDSSVEVILTYGHNFNYWYGYQEITPATCTESGVNLYTCSVCGATEEGESAPLGHYWINGEIDLATHTVTQTCDNGCGGTQVVSTLGWEEDPIEITVPGSFTCNATGDWTYYTFEHVEGYITFTFDTDNANVMVLDTTYTHATQYFWGGTTTWTAELMVDGSYLVAISTGDFSELEIAVTTEMEETDVPNIGEVAEKPITIEYTNTAYLSTGKVWYSFMTPTAGKVTITVSGDAVVSYGLDPEELTVYAEPFTDESGWTSYYILVESEAEVEVIVDVETPVGSMDNPLEIVLDTDNVISTNGGWAIYYAAYTAPSNGMLTVNFDSATYSNVVIYVGTHPYQMQTSVTDGTEIEVYGGFTYYFGVSTSDYAPVEFTLTASFEGEAVEVPTPSDDIGKLVDSLELETTDTYTWVDMYTYVAEEAGQYTFFVPGYLGFYSKEAYDSWAEAEVDPNIMENPGAGAWVTVDLEADEEYSFYIGMATEKTTWTIDVYFLAK